MKLKPNFPKQIRNIIFDLGGVLLDIDIHRSISAFESLHIEGLKAEDIHPHQRQFFLDLELGLITGDQFVEQLKTAYPGARNTPEEHIWEAWNALLLDFDLRRFDLLRSLSEHYSIYLLSNTNLPHRIQYLRQFREASGTNFDTFFTKCYYSDQLKLRKPDPRIYQYVLDDAQLTPDQCLFIDDNDCNFSGAHQVGMHTWHLQKPQTIFDGFE